eukprot:gb/GEZN01010128.1/.p1 GENE.gb/GEZN01010128.1/~~gb/GEZN01010128.1/.p1  ORF type:complete len:395 (-),score=30.10 gb/GEZN01010128.1/:60-1244(-)
MSGVDYVPLEDGLNVPGISSFLFDRAARGAVLLLFVLGGLTWTSRRVNSLANNLRLSQGQGEQQGEGGYAEKRVPFYPKQDVAKVLVQPMLGPPPTFLYSPATKNIFKPNCLFLYGSMLEQLFPGTSPDLEEVWVYGARITRGRLLGIPLASPTGNNRDILKGHLFCWSPLSVSTKLCKADKLLSFDAAARISDSLKRTGSSRGAISVIRKDGSSIKAYWYFKDKTKMNNRDRRIYNLRANKTAKTSDQDSLGPSKRKYVNKPLIRACPECGKIFPQTGQLVEHRRRWHTGEKPYVCEVDGCDKACTSKKELLDHARRAHTGDKPYKCTEPGCGKAFVAKTCLNVHVRSHTGERPYPCLLCSAAFTVSGNLRRHIRRVHPDEHLELNETATAIT